MPNARWTMNLETPQGHEGRGVMLGDATHRYGGAAGCADRGTDTTHSTEATLTGPVAVVRHHPRADGIVPSRHEDVQGAAQSPRLKRPSRPT